MPDIHCCKQTKLSKTMGSPLDTMGEIISSRCPILKVGVTSIRLMNCFFPCGSILLHQLRKETCSVTGFFFFEIFYTA